MEERTDTLEIAVLGQPEVRCGGRRLAFPTRKTLALLIYLAVEGGPQRRDTVAALFWPESDEEHAGRSLRSTLTFVRRALEEGAGTDSVGWLTTDRDVIELAGATVALDLQVLHRGYECRNGHDAADLAALRAAAAVCRGDFLAGFSLVDAPEFDTWVAVERERWHRRAEAVFECLTERLAAAGDLDGAIETAIRWQAHDPLNERAYRSLIRLYLHAGNRAAALQVYHACSRVLAEELGTEVSLETEALAAQIRGTRTLRAEPVPFGATMAGQSPLVGRETEHAWLVDELRHAERGTARFVVLEGEAGIGKSRLLHEFLRSARADGAEGLLGHGYETGGRPPFHPLVEALGACLEEPNSRHDLLPDVWLAELSRIMPRIRELRPDLPPPVMAGDAGGEARLLYEAMARLVASGTRDTVTAVALDDFHWADAATLDALPYLCRRWRELPVVVILSLRPEEVGETKELRRWLSAFREEFAVSTVTLPRLCDEDTAALIRSLLVHPAGSTKGKGAWGHVDPPSRLVEWLTAQAAGYPMFVVETVRELVERGALRYDSETGWHTAELAAALSDFIATRVQAIIEARIARAGDDAQRMAGAAAVIGGLATFASLSAVAGLEEEAGLTALDELVERRVLRESGGRYDFHHDLIRHTVYRRLRSARRTVWHRRALEALSREGQPAGELVRHTLAADLPQRAAELSVRAGDDALRVFAVRDAIDHYERALQLGADEVDRRHVLAQLGMAYMLSNERGTARDTFTELLRVAQEERVPATECLALNRLADIAAHELDFVLQARLLEDGLAAAERSGDPVSIADTEWNLGQLCLFRSMFAAATRHHERSLTLARAAGLPALAARTLGWMAIADLLYGRWETATAHATEGLELARAVRNPFAESELLSQLAGATLRLGRIMEGTEVARRGFELAGEIGHAWGRAACAMEVAFGLEAQGDFAGALAVARAGIEAGRGSTYAPLLLLNLTRAGCAARCLGELALAVPYHREALAVAEMTHDPAFIELVASELCIDAATTGDWQEAHRWALMAAEVRMPEVLYSAENRPYEIEALVRGGDAARAREEVRRFAERIDSDPHFQAPYLRSLAVLARHNGNATRAAALENKAKSVAWNVSLSERE